MRAVLYALVVAAALSAPALLVSLFARSARRVGARALRSHGPSPVRHVIRVLALGSAVPAIALGVAVQTRPAPCIVAVAWAWAIAVAVWVLVRYGPPFRRAEMRARIQQGDGVDEAVEWLAGHIERERARIPLDAPVDVYAQWAVLDANELMVAGEPDRALALLGRIADARVEELPWFDAHRAVMVALGALQRGEPDAALAALPPRESSRPPSEGATWDLVAAVRALALSRSGRSEEATADLAAPPTGMPYATALRAIARADLAALRGDRGAALDALAGVRARANVARVPDLLPGPARAIEREQGPYGR